MEGKTKEKIQSVLRWISLVLSCFNCLMFFSRRTCWSGISKTLGYEKNYNPFILYLPVILFVLLFVLRVLTIVFFFVLKKKCLWNDILLPVHILFSVTIRMVFAFGGMEYARFIFVSFLNAFLLCIPIGLLVFFLFYYPLTKLSKNRIFQFSVLSLVLFSFCIYIFNFRINTISYEPVVYRVEDTYQIIFSSSTKSSGYVEVGEKRYYDTYAGSQKSEEKVHKVVVPMSALDEAKSYTIYSQSYLYRGPFGAIKGTLAKKSYSFVPVNTDDGLNYYSFSDIHGDLKGAENARNKGAELLILDGDIISDVNTFEDANFVNKVAYKLTKGKIPVLYARGNHELKGPYSEQLYKFVPSVNEKFYYSFRFGNVYGWVLDLGEDHDDDWWEYYGSADFDSYRYEQVEFLKKEEEKGEYRKYDYHLVISHIPLPFINYRLNHVPAKIAFVEQLNKRDIDRALCGHQHDLFIFEPGLITPGETLTYSKAYGGKKYKGYLLDYNFPSLRISKHGRTQTDKGKSYNARIGLNIRVDFNSGISSCQYNNVKGEKINVVNPFYEKDYGDTIRIDLKTKEFLPDMVSFQ